MGIFKKTGVAQKVYFFDHLFLDKSQNMWYIIK